MSCGSSRRRRFSEESEVDEVATDLSDRCAGDSGCASAAETSVTIGTDCAGLETPVLALEALSAILSDTCSPAIARSTSGAT